jgi:hypothetical protein
MVKYEEYNYLYVNGWTHNPLVVGSNPTGPTNTINWLAQQPEQGGPK